MAKTGTIGVTTENIFPVIKKFLYLSLIHISEPTRQ